VLALIGTGLTALEARIFAKVLTFGSMMAGVLTLLLDARGTDLSAVVGTLMAADQLFIAIFPANLVFSFLGANNALAATGVVAVQRKSALRRAWLELHCPLHRQMTSHVI